MPCAHAGTFCDGATDCPAPAVDSVARIPLRSPDAKLSLSLIVVRRSGLMATEPADCASPVLPPAQYAALAPPATEAPARAVPAIARSMAAMPLRVAATDA